MVRLEGVSYRYSTAGEWALRDIDLQIEPGECVLIAGDSGCGKSTLLYTVNGLIPHLFPGHLEGQVKVGDVQPGDLPLEKLSQRVGTVFQNPDNQLFMLAVADDVAFGCENLCLPRGEIIERVDESLRQVGLDALRQRAVFSLSGGQKQRCAMAGILAMSPEVLVLDEPTADLDGDGTGEVFEQLAQLRRQGKTILLVEHKLEEACQLADRLVVLQEGRIVEQGPPREVLGRRGRALQQLDLPDVSHLGLTPTPLTVDEARASLVGHARAMGLLASSTEPPATCGPGSGQPPAISVRDLHFSYNGSDEALRGVSFDIQGGEIVAIVGANGSGKTTLFRVLTGLERATAGQVVVGGIADPRLSDLVGRATLLFQNPDEQLFCDTVSQEIAFGPGNLDAEVDANAWVEAASLQGCAERHPQTLSRGERQRLALVSLLAMQPSLLLLDEPTTGLDYGNWSRVLEMARGLARQGRVVFFSTHNMKAVGQFADRVLLLSEGRLIADGPPHQVFAGDVARYGLRLPQAMELSRDLGRLCLTWRELAQALQPEASAC